MEEAIQYYKTEIDDGGLVSDALAFVFPRGDDGMGKKFILLVDSRSSDLDLIPIRDKVKRCLAGEERCPKCGWQVELEDTLTLYLNGVRRGFTCFCTYAKGER